ncbi:hypothetical protein HGRIS_001724 [Hohenbuehelia grisea]|uniref:Uncharacterized protein n=1 Tax=Hohenbuehelia grisea TaxID=104357 RepID=A0ABR3JIA6_9AGAR
MEPSPITHVGWSDVLVKLLQPPKRTSLTIDFGTELTTITYPPCQILLPSNKYLPGAGWRSELVHSVLFDLTSGAVPQRAGRLVRFDSHGIGGLLLYDLNLHAPESPTARGNVGGNALEDSSAKLGHPAGSGGSKLSSGGALDGGGALTLNAVFGDPDDPSDVGMEVDELLDCIHAKLVCLPLYACTSFVTGQVMNALVYNKPIQPRQAARGILLDTSIVNPFENLCTPSRPKTEVMIKRPIIDAYKYLRRTMPNATSLMGFEEGNTDQILRKSCLKPSELFGRHHDKAAMDENLSEFDSDTELSNEAPHLGDTSVSTIDSLGSIKTPCRPFSSRSKSPFIDVLNTPHKAGYRPTDTVIEFALASETFVHEKLLDVELEDPFLLTAATMF